MGTFSRRHSCGGAASGDECPVWGTRGVARRSSLHSSELLSLRTPTLTLSSQTLRSVDVVKRARASTELGTAGNARIHAGTPHSRLAIVATAVGLSSAALVGVVGHHASGAAAGDHPTAALTSIAAGRPEASSETSSDEIEPASQLITTQGNATASLPSEQSTHLRGRRRTNVAKVSRLAAVERRSSAPARRDSSGGSAGRPGLVQQESVR